MNETSVIYFGFIVFVVISLIDITPGNLHGYNVYYDKKYLSCPQVPKREPTKVTCSSRVNVAVICDGVKSLVD